MKISGDIRVVRKAYTISKGVQECSHEGVVTVRCFESPETFVERTVCYGCGMKKVVRTVLLAPPEEDASAK